MTSLPVPVIKTAQADPPGSASADDSSAVATQVFLSLRTVSPRDLITKYALSSKPHARF
jgi:hypothetical protein